MAERTDARAYQGKSVGSSLSFTINVGDGYLKVESTVFVGAKASDEEIKEALATQQRLFWEQYKQQVKTVAELKRRLKADL